MTSFVNKLGKETEQLRRDLAASRPRSDVPKLNKPAPFSSRAGAIDSWASHKDTCVSKATSEEALLVATSHLQGEAFAWWQTYTGKSEVTDWPTLREALKQRFNPLNKLQAARDLRHKWKQMKDVASYNKSFQSIILDIPDITMTEQIDRYSRGLKSYIWAALCLKQYDTLDAVMRNALRVEAAKRGILFDDGALTNFVSSAFVKRLGIATDVSSEAAPMPDGSTYNLTSTKDPLEVLIQDYQDDLYFAVCPLASNNVILGKKWHEDYNVRKKYRMNVITFRENGRAQRINAALELSKTIWSKHRIAQHLKRRNVVFAIHL
eukprot:contig_9276_g2213